MAVGVIHILGLLVRASIVGKVKWKPWKLYPSNLDMNQKQYNSSKGWQRLMPLFKDADMVVPGISV